VLPAPLHHALRHVFSQGVDGCVLVGGTAIAGYYAGHRRSDDLELFVRDANALRATVLAVGSLQSLGATITVDQSTSQFCSVTASLEQHVFTAQVVLDAALFTFGAGQRAADNVVVATLDTLFKQKAATLVSRASEKDLYDLLWLLARRPELSIAEMVALGREVDQGVNAENMLLVLASTPSSEAACDFALHETPAQVLVRINAFKTRLMDGLDRVARRQPAPKLGELIRALRPR